MKILFLKLIEKLSLLKRVSGPENLLKKDFQVTALKMSLQPERKGHTEVKFHKIVISQQPLGLET